MTIKLTLPYPVSANRYWRTAVVGGKVRTYRSKDANEYRHAVQWFGKEERVKPHDGDYSIELIVHPRMTVNNKASRIVIDIDNAIKVTLDALEGVVYNNDGQVKQVKASYGKPVIGGALTVIAERLERGTK